MHWSAGMEFRGKVEVLRIHIAQRDDVLRGVRGGWGRGRLRAVLAIALLWQCHGNAADAGEIATAAIAHADEDEIELHIRRAGACDGRKAEADRGGGSAGEKLTARGA